MRAIRICDGKLVTHTQMITMSSVERPRRLDATMNNCSWVTIMVAHLFCLHLALVGRGTHIVAVG